MTRTMVEEPADTSLEPAPGGGLGRCGAACPQRRSRPHHQPGRGPQSGARDHRDGGAAHSPGAAGSAAAVHGAGGARRHRARQRQPARLPRQLLPARRPHHGRPADVALSLARRHVLGREGLRPVAHRAAAQSGRGRHAGAARALHAPDLRGRPRAPGAPAGARLRQGGRPRGHRPLRRQPARCAGPACKARDVDLGQGPGGGRDARGGARAHPGCGADRGRQVEPGERARQRRGSRPSTWCP